MSLHRAIKLLRLIRINVIHFSSGSQEKHPVGLRVPPPGSIPTFNCEMEQFVLIALKSPVVSSYFMNISGKNTARFDRPRGQRQKCQRFLIF